MAPQQPNKKRDLFLIRCLLLLPALDKRNESSDLNLIEKGFFALANGFMTPTLNPLSLSIQAKPLAIVVLPTPVFVPVIKIPCIKILLELSKTSFMMLTLADKDKKYVWHPYTQMSDWRRSNNKVIVRGKGFYLIDSEGRKYLDGIASMWCNVWGHGNTIVSKKLTEQNKFLQHSTLFGLANSPSVMLAERLLKLAKGMGKVFYSDNGSTAIEIGLKIAFQYWRNKGIRNRTKFISLKNGYHGDTIGAMSVGYIRDFFSPYEPMLKKVLKVPSPSLSSCKHYDANEDTEACLQETEDVLLKNTLTMLCTDNGKWSTDCKSRQDLPKKVPKKNF